MANLPETPQWEEGIYQIEVSDPVLGGPDGISNRQGKQLASRTLYLKQQVEKGGSDLAKHIAAADPHTQYAPKASPTFTGTPTAPTPANSDNSKKLATTEFVAKALAALAGSAPETLDTLKELADALGNDPNFATTVLNKLAEKLAKDQNGADIPDPALFVKNLGLQTIKPDPVSTKIFSPDLKKFLLVSNTSFGMWNNDTGAAIALPVSQGGTGQTTVDGVKAAFGIDKLQPKGNYVITDASTKQSLSDALSCRYGLEITDSNNIARVGIYSANNQATITGINGKAIIIPDKAGTMALAGESVSALRLSAPREVTVTTADAWMNFTTSEMVVGIYITPTPGGGAWVLNKVKVATLQAYINGAWVNVTQ
ncbi:phage tail protein [Escherichia coli]|uniref:phage tail protein n=1 Tax=Escherichia coli TaxID=562 RepID=UPI002023574F|nr:phage tail protein [Escherichia coli]